MRYLQLKSEAFKVGSESVSTAMIVRAALNDTGQGIKLDELRSRSRVLDALDRCEGDGLLALEDTDAKVLQRCVQNGSWSRVDPGLLACLESIMSMSDKPLAAVPAAPAA